MAKGGGGVMRGIKREASNTLRVHFRRLNFFFKPRPFKQQKRFWAAKQLLKGVAIDYLLYLNMEKQGTTVYVKMSLALLHPSPTPINNIGKKINCHTKRRKTQI